MAYTLPMITATTPTVVNGITYGIWAVTAAVILEETEPNGPADSNGPHYPLDLRWNATKGRIHPDGYFDLCPTVAPVEFRIDQLINAAQSDASLQSLLNSVVNAIGTRGKAAGIL